VIPADAWDLVDEGLAAPVAWVPVPTELRWSNPLAGT
jgi:hypothetical protein